MRIHVHLILQTYTGKEEIIVPIQESIPLADLLNEIGIPGGEIGMIVRNGRWIKPDSLVTDSDEVDLFPILSGG